MYPSNPSELEATTPEGRSIMPLTLMRLEERIVLDAGGVADADHQSSEADHTPDQPVANAAPAPQEAPRHAGPDAADGAADPADFADPAAQLAGTAVERAVSALLSPDNDLAVPRRVLVVSSGIDQAEALAGAAADDVLSTVFDGQDATLDGLLQQIRDALDGHAADSIALATHGLGEGGFELAGGYVVNLETLQNPELRAFWEGLAQLVESGGRIDLLACDAAEGPQGQALLAALEDLTGVDFAASIDDTGNAAQGGDWVLETDHIEAGSIYFDPQRLSGFTELLDNQPTITDTNPGNTAVGGQGPVVVDAGINVEDGDGGGDTLRGAVVRIKTGLATGEDQLAYDTVLAASYGIGGSYDATTGELVLSGDASAAEYQQVLRTVTYQNTSATPDTTARGIFFVIGDDFDNPGGYNYDAQTGHYYQLVDDSVLWVDAEAAAAGSTLGGLQGYLGTITSASENTFITDLIPGGQEPWLGASDAATEGEFLWVNGPETGTQFWQGHASGSPVGGMYTNWDAGEPNNSGNSDYLRILSSGLWRDRQGTANQRYVVEYGGMASDAEAQLTASVMLNVAAPNQAPLLDNTGTMSLSSIDEDDTGSAGDTVASIVASAGGDRITDPNAGAAEGMALTSVDNTHGTWQYSTNGGGNWSNVGLVAESNALLLRDTDLLRFQPDPDWNGTVTDAIAFRAWDQTSGSAGGYADTTVNGGSTAFSIDTESASLVVNSVNDAPVLDNSGSMSLTGINEDDASSAGDTVASIISSAGGDPITDVDTGAAEGIALIGVDNTRGSWQYSTNGGGSWSDVGPVAAGNALLLRDTDLLRFQPDPDWNGTVTDGITFRAWDRTAGSAGGYADTTGGGGTTAFSAAIETASLVVNNVNDAPTVANPLVDQSATEDAVFTYQLAANTFDDVDVGDTLTYAATLADGSPLPDWLAFDPARRTFSGTPRNPDVGTLDVRVTADDGRGGSVSDVFTITVTNVNDPPTVANPLVDQTATEDAAFTYQPAANTFDDVDWGNTLAYTATLADGSPLPAWFTFDPATHTFSGTPRNADVGTFSVRVTADDGHGGSVSDVFAITVANANDPPTVAIPLFDQSVWANSEFSYQLAPDTFDDIDAGDTLTYTASLANGSPLPGWLVFDPATGTFSGRPGRTDAGMLSVKVTANDGHGGTASDVFTITVSAANVAPPQPNPPQPNPPQPNPPQPPPNNNNSNSNSSPSAAPSTPAEPSSTAPDDAGTPAADDGGTTGTEGGDPADTGDSADAGEATDAGEAADTGEATDGGAPAEAADGGADASSATGGADGKSVGGAGAAGGPSKAGGGQPARDVHHHEREEELELEARQLTAQISGAMFSGNLLADESQPEEFREAWNTILSAYAESGEELSTYLQSAFRAVTESALMYQEAERSVEALRQELALSAESGMQFDADALLADLTGARDDVKAASTQLESAILAAAQAGRDAKFDQALEDVVVAALEQLMTANERLFVETQALTAAAAVLHDARLSGESTIDEARLAAAAAQARLDAHAAVAQMRESWDRVAQDVFSAFVERLVAEQGEAGSSAGPG